MHFGFFEGWCWYQESDVGQDLAYMFTRNTKKGFIRTQEYKAADLDIVLSFV